MPPKPKLPAKIAPKRPHVETKKAWNLKLRQIKKAKAKKVKEVKPVTNVPPPERQKSGHKARALKKKINAVRRKVSQEKRTKKTNEMIKRYYKYRRYFQLREKQLKLKRKIAKLFNNYFVEPEPKVAFVIRIRGICDMPPKPKKILQLLRLRQLNNGVFVRLNKAVMNMLRIVSPWVAWGYPSLNMIRRLMYRRARLKFKGQRKRITNPLIEAALHKYNIICMEDLVFQIAACGKYFQEVNRSLWPFKLRCPKRGFRSIKKHFVEGGDYGNREFLMDKLIKRMM